jgi:hypothetical protein
MKLFANEAGPRRALPVRIAPLLLAGALAWAGAVSLAGCGGTGFQQTWAEPTAVGVTLGKVGVVGVAADPAVRTEFEDAFARTLNLRGNDAKAGHTFIPETMRGQLEAIRQKLADEKFEGVLVTRLAAPGADAAGVGVLEERLKVPMSAATGDSDTVQLRTSFYRVSDGKLMWEAITANERTDSIRKSAAAFSETVARELYAQGMLR